MTAAATARCSIVDNGAYGWTRLGQPVNPAFEPVVLIGLDENELQVIIQPAPAVGA